MGCGVGSSRSEAEWLKYRSLCCRFRCTHGVVQVKYKCTVEVEAFGCNPGKQSDRALHSGCFRYCSLPQALIAVRPLECLETCGLTEAHHHHCDQDMEIRQVTGVSLPHAYSKMADCCMQTSNRKRQVGTCRNTSQPSPGGEESLKAGFTAAPGGIGRHQQRGEAELPSNNTAAMVYQTRAGKTMKISLWIQYCIDDRRL